ncbi:hypothetical protein VTN77DRAFT_8496 [Rasamsonia byssochlamydoides]|uniref:uncharacterized protein n=1 Tax=Rasamsonia byssochlamydoides TaxID=89139 RepID=UPI003742DA27
MSASPAKRRKTSPTTAVPIDAPESTQADSTAQDVPVPPPVSHRPSFQSPTRASLARSNPEILSHVFNRSPTRSPQRPTNESEERVFGLRDRKALRPSLTAAGSPGGFLALSPRRRSGAIQAFAAPPRRVSRRIEIPNVDGTQEQNVSTPVHSNTPDEQLASELDSATRESEARNPSVPPLLQEEYGEPELPPTPTELGLEKRPERPKGLLSSPSSRKHRREGLRPSTLRLDQVQLSSENNQSEDDMPEVVRKKQKLRDELAEQLERLKSEVAQLESWAQRTERLDDPEPDVEAVRNLISLLTTSNPSCAPSSLAPPDPPPLSSLISSLLPFSAKAAPEKPRPTSPDPTNPFVLKELADPTPYLTVFAPLNLLTYSTKISAEPTLTETHSITLSAPPPFPRHLYKIPLTFKTNLESQCVTSISISNDQSAKIPPALHGWMNSRLANPLLQLDVSGLCWGICRYWEASVCRARIWAKLKRKHEALVAGVAGARIDNNMDSSDDEEEIRKPLKKSDLRALIPHLERTSMIFSSGANKKRESKLLLSCPLTLDEWTSEPQLKPEISISIPPDLVDTMKRLKVERDVKRLFRTLLKEGRRRGGDTGYGDTDGDAIVKATEGVMGVLFGIDVLTARSNGTGKQ